MLPAGLLALSRVVVTVLSSFSLWGGEQVSVKNGVDGQEGPGHSETAHFSLHLL